MNYTKNHHLPQWEETDRIMRTDFNQMCADMEAGLNKTASDAAAATANARAEASTALAAVRTTAANAQNSANAAQASANAARTVADAAFCPSYMPFAAGTYTGTASTETPTKITLGFRPSVVIIMDGIGHFNTSFPYPEMYMASESTADYGLTFLEDGFSVISFPASLSPGPNLNHAGQHPYVAFR